MASRTVVSDPLRPVSGTLTPIPTRREPVPAEKSPATPSDIEAVRSRVRATAEQFGLDPDLMEAIAYKESRFNPAAVSPKGARGPMQVMPATSAELRTRYGDDNIVQGVGYFKELLQRFDGDITKALVAYNAGPGRLERATRLAALRNTDLLMWVPPETQTYVKDILAAYEARKSERGGVAPQQALAVDPRAARVAVEYGINSIGDLPKIPGFARLSLDGKKELAKRFGYDVSAIPDAMLVQLFEEAAGPLVAAPTVPGGAVGELSVPGAVATAIENRIVDPIRTAFSPSASTLERGLALGEIAGAVAAPAWMAANVGAQSALNWMVGDNDVAPFIGALVEIGGGVRSWTAAARRGKAGLRTMRKSLDAAAQGGLKAEEVIGQQIRSVLRGRLARIKERVSTHRRVAEQYIRANPHWKADRTMPEYQSLADSLENMWRDGLIGGVSPSVHYALSGIREQLALGKDIPARSLYELKELLRREAAFVDRLALTGNPPGNRNVLTYLGQIRGRTVELLENTLRREPHRAAQSAIKDLQAADRLHERYVAPAFTFLRVALSAKATPMQAYRSLFSLQDPQALRTAVGLMNRAAFAGVRDKIRLGFAKHLADTTADFVDIPKVIRVLKNHEEFLSKHNIYTQRELRDLQVFFRKRNLTSLRSMFHRDIAATSTLGVAASAGATALAIGATPMLAARNIETGRFEYQPRNLMIAAMVTGTTPLLLRLGVRPHDPVAATKAAEQLIGGFSTILRRIAYTAQVGEPALDDVDPDPAPK